MRQYSQRSPARSRTRRRSGAGTYFCAMPGSCPLEPQGGPRLGQADQVFDVLVLLPFPLLFGGQAAAAVLLQQVVDASLEGRGRAKGQDLLGGGQRRQRFQDMRQAREAQAAAGG